MGERTLSSMHDARDAHDNQLLEAGEHKLLLHAYFHPVSERCWLRLRDDDAASEVTQRVFDRLLRELARGKRYRVPFRVVVWMVVEWTIKGYFDGKPDAELPDDLDAAAPDAFEEWEADHDLGLLLANLPDRQREVCELRYREGLDHEQIAERLGMTRNAVDQALHNGHKKLREKLSAG